ncbi:MAG TPA: hypothetical protein VFV03_09500 [Solirubrobacteraceae bacterium]|nr:hypothetical protein [Solirubrobacteraceae bacterium]
MSRRPKLELPFGDHVIAERPAPSASPAEAAAIVAALERFMRDTAPRLAPPAEDTNPWLRMAMLEGVSREGQDDVSDPWINT